MPSCPTQIWLNAALTVVIVATLLGCGGDPVDPPKGSVEEKLYGDWEAEPLPPAEGEEAIRHTARNIDVHCWDGGPRGVHLSAWYNTTQVRKDGTEVFPGASTSTRDFTIDGVTATSDVAHDGSVWVLRLDPNDQHILYATWTLKDGTKRLDEVRFRKRK